MAPRHWRTVRTCALLAIAFALPATVLGIFMMRLFPLHPGMIATAGWFLSAPAGLVASALAKFSFWGAWALGFLSEAVLLVVPLLGWSYVRRNREQQAITQRSRLVLWGGLLILNAYAASVFLEYAREMKPPLAVPEKLIPGEFRAAKKSLKDEFSLSYASPTFALGKLYVASGLGLLEVGGEQVTAIYRWHYHSLIDGAWSGAGGKSLWVQKSVDGNLAQLDDSGWRNVPMPKPERGLTRGDVLSGIKMAKTKDDLWVSSASTLWKWAAPSRTWTKVPVPNMASDFQPLEVYATSSGPVALLGANEMFGARAGAFLLRGKPDGTWERQSLDDCCVKYLTAVGTDLYYANKAHELIQVAANGTKVRIESPGDIEALTASSGGLLIASVRDIGVFSYDGKWTKMFDCPYLLGAERLMGIAENNGVIAMTSLLFSESKQQANGNGLWVSSQGKLVRIEIPN